MNFDPMVDKCHRCGKSVYHVEKMGPINGVIYHRGCFRCFVCNQNLTMKTYFNNGFDVNDRSVFCTAHVPKSQGSNIDSSAVGIKGPLDSQAKYREFGFKVNEQIRGTDPGKSASIDAEYMLIKRALTAPKVSDGRHVSENPHISSDAMCISTPVNAQILYKGKHRDRYDKHNYPAYVKTRNKILKAQKLLEEKQRQEEDRLYSRFTEERQLHDKQVKTEVQEEWEAKLKELTAKFDKEIGKKKKKIKDEDKKYLTLQFQKEKEDLEKNMTLRREKKRKYMTLKLVEKEQAETSSLVQKHSKEMLELIVTKQKEITQEILNDVESEQVLPAEIVEPVMTEQVVVSSKQNGRPSFDASIFIPVMEQTSGAPQPCPPRIKKSNLYTDPTVFKDIDEDVFNIAESEQQTFTDLVALLTEKCSTDLEKVRAIFRWITVKDLNIMEMEETLRDTPLDLLRGIKFGTETYHVLFMRLCSYAGLHCVEIKGHSKSVGYEPGMKIKDNMFLNTWNAVYVDGDWRLVQCNWGARHLVLNKDSSYRAEAMVKKSDKIRYQYDEHYFLTDPCDFILEFWPFDPEWQLLATPLSQEQFEALPFVRSIFFHHKMQLEGGTKAVIFTDERGGTQVRLRVPEELVKDLVFHHQLRFADEHRRDWKEYKGTKMERFVFQTTIDNHIVFSAHVPTTGEYFLEIFANKIDDTNRVGDDPNAPMMPFRLKCACKFRLVCRKMTGKMHPLPNCATGEWGPMKAFRHFDIKPITHETGVINEDNEIEIKLGVPRPLQFLAKMHVNGINDHLLDDFVQLKATSDVLTIRVTPPQPGQYGLDIFARPEGAKGDNVTLAHACKFLINSSKIDNPRPLPTMDAANTSKMTKDKWGPTPAFAQRALKAITHPDHRISHNTNDNLVVEFGYTRPIQFAYHMIREPDEDHRENVSLTMDEKNKTARFTISLSIPGNYLFAIYCKELRSQEKAMANVYNYMILFKKESSQQPVPPQQQPRRLSSSGLFGKLKKDKDNK